MTNAARDTRRAVTAAVVALVLYLLFYQAMPYFYERGHQIVCAKDPTHQSIKPCPTPTPGRSGP